MRRSVRHAFVIVAFLSAACGAGQPATDGLRDSFIQQLAANRFIKDAQPGTGEIRFSGPGVDGKDRSAWRVRVDSAVVEANSDAAHPYKGTVKSSWYADDQLVRITPGQSNLPIELTSNGLAQECWALWNEADKRWSWE